MTPVKQEIFEFVSLTNLLIDQMETGNVMWQDENLKIPYAYAENCSTTVVTLCSSTLATRNIEYLSHNITNFYPKKNHQAQSTPLTV